MTKRRLKKSVVPMLYVMAIVAVLGCAYMIESVISNQKFNDDDHYGRVSDTVIEDSKPVVGEEEAIQKVIRPYNDGNVKIVKGFYDYTKTSEEQQSALIYHDNTYIQNSGVCYGGVDSFDVIAVMDGTVIEVKEDNLLGKIVQIKHEGELVSVYQSLGNVNIKKDDVIKQGDIIGTSGTSNINKDLNNHLSFELIKAGAIVNPEDLYDKTLNQQ